MKQVFFVLILLGVLTSCARTSTGEEMGRSDYSYTSSPSYNNGNTHQDAQTTAAKMISPVTGY